MEQLRHNAKHPSDDVVRQHAAYGSLLLLLREEESKGKLAKEEELKAKV